MLNRDEHRRRPSRLAGDTISTDHPVGSMRRGPAWGVGRFLVPALLILAACDETTAPDLGSNLDAAAMNEPLVAGEIVASVDPDLNTALLSEVEVALSANGGSAPDMGEASLAFSNAALAFSGGDLDGAHAYARQGRSLLAHAWTTRKGAKGVDELFARIRHLQAGLEDDELVDDSRIRAALETLLDRAARARSRGRSDQAVSDLLLAGQLVDHGRLESDRNHDGHSGKARFAVSRAHAAVALAERLFTDGATDSQNRLLARAAELTRSAAAALDEGAYRRAFALGRRAESTALMAVLDTDGPSDDEVRLVHDLAETLLREAQAVQNPSVIQERLISMAAKQLELGERKLAAGLTRGVGLLWRSAVTSSLAVAG